MVLPFTLYIEQRFISPGNGTFLIQLVLPDLSIIPPKDVALEILYYTFKLIFTPNRKDLPVYKGEGVGSDMGLIVVVNVSSDDYYYNAFNSIGFNVSVL